MNKPQEQINNDNRISLKNISKSFGEKAVLKNFSRDFKKGEFSSVMGVSGSGKTTLVNIILGIETPDEGSLSGVPEKLSAVFQENRLSENFSGVSNVKLSSGGRLKRREIEELLGSLGLDGEVKKPVSRFSGGMKRRVAIARALAADYDLLVLDEPFKELDKATKTLVMETVKQKTAGKTVILVTHSRSEAEFFGGDIIEIN